MSIHIHSVYCLDRHFSGFFYFTPHSSLLTRQIGKFRWITNERLANEHGVKLGRIPWAYHFAALAEYGRQHGTCNISARGFFECDITGVDGQPYHYAGKLGSWVVEQRRNRKGRMPDVVRTSVLQQQREQMLQELVDSGEHRFMEF